MGSSVVNALASRLDVEVDATAPPGLCRSGGVRLETSTGGAERQFIAGGGLRKGRAAKGLRVPG